MIKLQNDDLPSRIEVSAALKATENLVKHTLKNSPKAINEITTHLSKSAGKGIRAKLLILCAMGEDGLVPKEAVKGAAAIEIMHLATLVHDDIIDDAKTRRGITSVQSKFGKREAVICGDYLFCLSFASISTIYEPYTELVPNFAKTVSKLCLGEISQSYNNFNTEITFFEYLKIINGKTASLFYISAYGGATLGGFTKSECKNIGRFGSYLGMIFQILDDCKDYTFTKNEALKPVQNDLKSGVITLPLIMSFLKEPKLRGYTKNIILDGIEINKILKEVDRLDGVNQSLYIAEKYSYKAKKILQNIKNEEKYKNLTLLLEDTTSSIKIT
jgi:heptaprenyl diphosphate synthase